jgi:cytochrome c peroxidase
MITIRLLALSFFALALLTACSQTTRDTSQQQPVDTVKPLSSQEQADLLDESSSFFPALPTTMPGAETDTKELVDLGSTLYHDVRLSVNNKQSCNTCHNVDNGGAGVDNEITSEGALGKRAARNSPTALNAGFHFVQFWDGRAADLFEQAKGPILNPIEMGMPSAKAVEEKLAAIPAYTTAFAAAFPKAKMAVTFDNVARAIAAFERTLVSPSRYDAWVNGDKNALTPAEQRGLQTFINRGCIACHNGTMFGGGMYQKLGLVHPYTTKDAGRFEVTKDPSDSLMFKVPTLRNVAATAPYFHDGSVKTLKEAIKLMAYHQVGHDLKEEEVASIEIFLKALTDPRVKTVALASH